MAILYSYVFVFGIIGVSALLTKIGWLHSEGSRKFIHIGVGNFIIIAYGIFDNVLLALIPPFTFVVLNFISYRYNLIPVMERDEKSSSDLGTVYYPISLFVLVLLDYLIFNDWRFSMLPILVMTYGDGLSAIVGTMIPSQQLVHNKTLYGTLTMFVVTLILAFIFINSLWMVLVFAIVATCIELFSPRGYDNLTVPILLYLVLLI